jgi:hypothetical protein
MFYTDRMRAVVGLLLLVPLAACPPDDEGDDELFDPALVRAPVGPVNPVCALPTNKAASALPGAVYFGTRAPTLVPLDAQQQNAVVGITDRFTAGTFCSGTLVSADVVLTAEHCVEGYGDDEMVVLFGVDEFEPLLSLESIEVIATDPDTDLAMIRLASAPPEDVARPLPIAIEPPDAADIGTLVEAAGYGDTQDGSEGRYFVTELFDSFDAGFITVNGQGERGVCFGDSGGPLLHVSDAGDVRVLGALSYGDEKCTNFDNFARADAQRAFIEEWTGPTPVGAPEACDATVTVEGACSVEQALVTYCEDGVVVRDACGADEICARVPNATSTVRCIPHDDNPCGAVTRFGACDGETLTWCNDDVVTVRACDACGERCLLTSEVDGFACVPSDCGSLDETGVCDGDVSLWCNESAQREEEACEDGCAYLGPVLGNYCYDPVACEGHTYQGSCNGDVLTWCEDNEVNVYDCGDDGTSCVFVDDEIGFLCE